MFRRTIKECLLPAIDLPDTCSYQTWMVSVCDGVVAYCCRQHQIKRCIVLVRFTAVYHCSRLHMIPNRCLECAGMVKLAFAKRPSLSFKSRFSMVKLTFAKRSSLSFESRFRPYFNWILSQYVNNFTSTSLLWALFFSIPSVFSSSSINIAIFFLEATAV